MHICEGSQCNIFREHSKKTPSDYPEATELTFAFRFCSIQEILRGGVKITHNHLLCNIDTIQWKDIVNSGDMVSVKSDFASFCEYITYRVMSCHVILCSCYG